MTDNVRNVLPQRFRFSHDFSLYLHDNLVSHLRDGEECDLFDTHFTLNPEEVAHPPAMGQHIFQWLEQHNRGDLLGEVLLKTIFPGLLSDFCHFIYESLSCSRKGKLTVAFALLRKPLRETLHYLEWLLADPDQFLNTLYNENASALAFRQIGDPFRVKKVIAAAVERCPNASMFDAEYLYELRFDKACRYGFDGLCNQALHLITTKPPIATAKQNLNFIFSDQAAFEAQWELLYGQLPYVLFYATEIVEVLIALIRKDTLPSYAVTLLHKSIGFILWGAEHPRVFGKPATGDGLSEFRLDCPRCNSTIPPSLAGVKRLYHHGEILCAACGSTLSIESFVKSL